MVTEIIRAAGAGSTVEIEVLVILSPPTNFWLSCGNDPRPHKAIFRYLTPPVQWRIGASVAPKIFDNQNYIKVFHV